MKFNLFRFLLFLLLPVVIISTVVFGVGIMESYEEKGEYLVPQNPVAHETAAFSYQLLDPSTHQPLQNASVHMEIVKTEALNPWLYAGYLREDHQGTGLVYEMDYLLNDGKIVLESNFWDAGSYTVLIHATAPGLQTPIDVKIPVEVKVPLGQIVNTAGLFAAILIAAMISGYVAGTLENPFKKTANTGGTMKTVVSVLVLGLLVTGNFSSAWAHGNGAPSGPVRNVEIEKSGVKAELKMNPAEPVQKGAPVHFAMTFRDAKTGEPVKGIDANVSLKHVDDNLTMFSTRTQIQNGQLEFDYAFPDTAEFQVVVHAAPNSPQSTLPAPFDGEFSFEVPPAHPNAGSQIRAGVLMVAAVAVGFVIGVVGGKRRKAAVA
ncbi:hypothetical protein [Effusibacillus lacus]|uniref:YtkA-like domain-containing protein n=1 Tax=Effusibacillus lacus TaxID=1348429 RepID=A0A292YQ47_9BACL|nr:hypothetical protein [Effusibacillus lacus]TCS75710.1 hypothetical protein EDD64_10682 [Effusibacillus lacus]GAX91029.1 hypothetical protein EFBL_2689 [Effusibacillus lacus]